MRKIGKNLWMIALAEQKYVEGNAHTFPSTYFCSVLGFLALRAAADNEVGTASDTGDSHDGGNCDQQPELETLVLGCVRDAVFDGVVRDFDSLRDGGCQGFNHDVGFLSSVYSLVIVWSAKYAVSLPAAFARVILTSPV